MVDHHIPLSGVEPLGTKEVNFHSPRRSEIAIDLSLKSIYHRLDTSSSVRTALELRTATFTLAISNVDIQQ